MQVKFFSVGCADGIHIRFEDENKIYRNILIDGGIGKKYEEIIKSKIQATIDRKENIDLWIISHIDNDHIGAILQFIKDEEIRNNINLANTRFWFNYYCEDYEVQTCNTNKKSVPQGIILRDFLKKNSLLVEEHITTALKQLDFHGVKLTILSPNEQKYSELVTIWKQKEIKIRKIQESKKISSSANDYDSKLENFDLSKFNEDNSETNGSSIAFLLEYNNDKKILFLADSHPSVIIESLKKLGYNTISNKLKIDYMQIPHHGSKNNSSDALLKVIECKYFIISADGYNKHNLPNKETLARYLKYFPNATFHFTHENDAIKSIFKVDRPRIINCKFPISPEKALVFNL